MTTISTPFPLFAVSIRIDGTESQVGLHVVYGINLDTIGPALLSDAPEDAAVAYFAPMLTSSTQPPTLCGQPLYSNRQAAEVAARKLLDLTERSRRVQAAGLRLADFSL
jgi:hypothetical protein